MLVLSILIMSALAVAVASFFIAGGQWLVIASALLVFAAFYLSRRGAQNLHEPEPSSDTAPPRPVREHLTVTIDNDILESGRHRGPSGEDEPTVVADLDDVSSARG